MKRRDLLLGTSALAAVVLGGGSWWQSKNNGTAIASEGEFEVTLTEAQWRERLTTEQFGVLRKEHTERPYSSALNDEKREGVFNCAGCELPLYASATKYESGTGWPSFYQPIDNAIGTRVDNSLFSARTEVHCRRCGGHLGHVFNDGPQPTGKRYCMNGVSLAFEPATA